MLPFTVEVLGISNLEDAEFLEKVLSRLVKSLENPEAIKITLRIRPEDFSSHLQSKTRS